MHVRATDAEWAHNTPAARPTLGTRYRARRTRTTHLARCPVPASQHVCPRPGRSQPLGPRPPHWWRWPWRCGCEVAPDTHWWNPQTTGKARQQTSQIAARVASRPARKPGVRASAPCVPYVDACIAGEAPHTHRTPRTVQSQQQVHRGSASRHVHCRAGRTHAASLAVPTRGPSPVAGWPWLPGGPPPGTWGRPPAGGRPWGGHRARTQRVGTLGRGMPGAAVGVGSERVRRERACVSVRGYGCVCECTCVGGCLCVGVRGWVRVFESVVVVVVVVSVHGGVGAGRRQYSRNRGGHSGTREQRRIGPNTTSSELILGGRTQTWYMCFHTGGGWIRRGVRCASRPACPTRTGLVGRAGVLLFKRSRAATAALSCSRKGCRPAPHNKPRTRKRR